jgi:BatD DUF11 like domain
MVKTIRLFFLLSTLLLTQFAFGLTVKTSLPRHQIQYGETFSVIYTANDINNQLQPDFSPLTKNFRILGNSNNTQITIINGVTTTQTIWQVVLEPKSPGVFTVPAIRFGPAKSKAATVKVVQSNTSHSRSNIPAGEPFFLRTAVTPKKPYIQSEVVYKLKLFYRISLSNPSIEPPRVDNATVLTIGNDKRYQTTYQGKHYQVVERDYAIFPQKSGPLTIGGAVFRALRSIQLNQFNTPPFFLSGQQHPVHLTTKPITLTVKPVPARFKGNNWLPAKKLTLNDKWSGDLKHWAAGSPLTRTISVRAEGLRADQLPDIKVTAPDGINVYPDPPKRENRLQGHTVVAHWTRKIAYIPNHGGHFSLPPIKLKWWNVKSNQPQTARLSRLSFNVTGAAPTSKQSSKPALPQATPTSTASKQTAPIATNTKHFYQTLWFWLALVFVSAWLATLALWLNGKRNHDADSSSETRHEKKPPAFKRTALQKACQQKDLAKVQHLLLEWAAIQWPDNPPRTLGALQRSINNAEFAEGLKSLQAALYSKQSTDWSGEDFWQAFKKLQSEHQQTSFASHDPLPPLNPS